MTDDPDDRSARMREQLLRDAAGLSWTEIWLRGAKARAALIAATLDLSDDQAAWAPAPDGAEDGGEEAWSTAQVMRHLITATPNVAAIIEATARGETAHKGPPGEINAEDGGVDQLRARLVAVSEQLLSVGRRLPEEPDAEATVPHAFFGELPSRAWMLFQALHDGMHIAQINDLRQAQGLPRAEPPAA